MDQKKHSRATMVLNSLFLPLMGHKISKPLVISKEIADKSRELFE